MDVRDAVESDADGMAAIADSPTDAMRNLIHDRSVRVAVEPASDAASEDAVAQPDANGQPDADGHPDADAQPEADTDPGDAAEAMLGFVSFDARPDAVHVTQLDGTEAACARLLEAPLAFARGEGMPVEVLVPDDHETVRDAVESAGFDEGGAGPRFEGQPTVRYRFDP